MVKLRAMTVQDLEACVALTQEVRWPHRLADWQLMLELGEGVVAEQQGGVVGSTLFWRWGAQRASLGVIVVAGALRGQGIGKAMLQHTLQQLEGWQLHLHATPAGAPLYRHAGFVAAGDVIQYQTPALTPPPVSVPVEDAQQSDLAALAQLDWLANGFHRLPLLQRLLQGGARITLLRGQHAPLGFAVTRRFGHGYVIGPVIAPDLQTAQHLITAAMQPLAGAFVRIDSRRAADLGLWLQETAGLQPVDNPLRMVRGSDWQLQGMTAWSLMSQAMG